MSFYVDIFLRQNLNIMFTISTKCDINKKLQTILTRRGIEKGNGKNEENGLRHAKEEIEKIEKQNRNQISIER